MNVVTAGGADTNRLVEHPGIAKILFTGSVETGIEVMQRAAKNLTGVVLELGGKDPAVVAADADLDRAAAGLVWGAFVNAGQTCGSVERVYVVEGRRRGVPREGRRADEGAAARRSALASRPTWAR